MAKHHVIGIVVGAGVLTLFDIISKRAAEVLLTAPQQIIPHVLSLNVSYNPGIAFSIPIPNIVMLFVAPAVIIGVIFYMGRVFDLKTVNAKMSLMLITAGAAGNFIDRIKLGRVVDFIDFSFWPSFNLADSYITIGVWLIIIFYGRIIKNHPNHGR